MDTLNTLPLYLSPCMGNIFELPNNQGYAVSNFYNYKFQLIYTNSYGHRTGQRTWNLFDTLEYSHGIRSSVKLQNGSYIIAGQTSGPSHIQEGFHGNLIAINSNLTDTLWTKKYQYKYQNIGRSTAFFYVNTAPNGSIWVAGLTALNRQSNAVTFLMHLSSTGTVLSQKHFNLTTGRNGPAYLSATSDGGCIVSILESGGNNDKQAIFIKLRADGSTQWTNEYGMTGQVPDDPLFIGKTQNPNEYWLFYNAGTVNAQNNYNGSLFLRQ